MRSFAGRLVWGARWGAIFGLAFVLIAIGLYAVSRQDAFEAHHTSFGKMALAYFFGGVSAGVIVGLLRPLARWKAGAALVGFTAILPVALLIRFATEGFGPWHPSNTVEAMMLGLILGAPVGLIYREIFSQTTEHDESN